VVVKALQFKKNNAKELCPLGHLNIGQSFQGLCTGGGMRKRIVSGDTLRKAKEMRR